MAGRIRQEDVDAVRQRADIVRLVSEHLQLRKAGADRYVGLCPFHPEKTPSFSVSAGKQAYHCFGCGEGGDAFRFVQRTEGLSFSEAVEKLAAAAGITLRYEGQSNAERRAAGRRQALNRAVAEAAGLYHGVLLEGREGAEARAYLEERGISARSVERFAIGYAPGYPDFVLRRLSRAFSPELLVEAGLVGRDSDGHLRDRFRGRLLFPIHDLSGNAVGFGGRLLGSRAAAGPKYVNSPESAVYRKGGLLYNLNRAKADATRAGRAVLVEGYTDVIALDQAGIPEAVATCGTALGEEHIRLLSRFVDRVVLAFDSDQAGARAAERAFQFHERYAVDLAVLVLPEGEDPADFVRAAGEAAHERFEEHAARAVPLVAYMIRRVLHDRRLDDAEEKSRAVKAALPIVAGLRDPVMREKYAALLADTVGVSVNAVLLEVDRATAESGRAGSESGRPREIASPSRVSPTQKVEREALKLIVQHPELCEGKLARLTEGHFATATYQKVFALVREVEAARTRQAAEANGAGPLASALLSMAHERGEQVQRSVAALVVEPPESEGPPTTEYAEQVFLRLEEFALTRRIDGMRRQLERLNPLTEPASYDALFEQLVALEGARRRVRVAAGAIVSSP